MKKFNWRPIEVEDYNMLKKWWKDWNWPSPPRLDMLPTDAILVYDVETSIPLYAGFLYTTGTSIGWMEYVVSNRDVSPDIKRGALDYLVESISTIAKNKRMTMLFTSTNNEPFINSLKKTDFQVADKNVTQMMKILY